MIILFESQFYPQELEKDLASLSKVTLDYAAHNLNVAIRNGLKQNGQKYELVNVPNVGSFPSLYKKIYVNGVSMDDGVSVGFWNMVFFKRYDISRKLYRSIVSSLREIDGKEKIVLLLYNYRCLPFLGKIKRQFPNVKTCMIVTDLPEYMVTPKNSFFNVGSKLIKNESTSSGTDVSMVDGFVFLAPKMSEKFSIEGKPWIQIEGIYESNTTITNVNQITDKVILYTGNLSERYGVLNLLNAFAGIQGDEYKLFFRGSGDCQNEILERSKSDKRITLLPPLSREDLLKLQKSATVLVNPVSPSETFTNYFFPSKTLEYLASGTPVIMYHLNCLPKEYDKYIYYIEEDSVEGLRKKLIEVCNKPIDELRLFGEEASKFIYDNKTPKPQMKKVIDFIKSL